MKKFALQDKKLLLLATSIALLVLLMPHGAVLAIGEGVAEDVFAWIVTLLLQIVGAVTYLGGTILNFVVKISIVDMKQWVEAAGIDNAWKVIRDVSNMGFIFILLYAAIMTILGKGSDNKRLIVNVVLAAVLMNFSLFFTKLFIDATNLVALLFYGQMVPASELVRGSVFTNQGLASTIMESIKIQSIWSGAAGDGVTITQIMLVGVLGSIVSLVAAFVFFAIAIMFVVRFVALLIVMVLSPLAFLAFALPQAEKYRKQWWDALSGQALFAPIYFLLTWVVISIAQSLAHNPVIQGVDPTDWAASLGGVAEKVTSADGTVSLVTKSNPQSTGIIVNFGIIIALLIASLTIAKEWANKAGGTATKLTKWATGAASNTAFGASGWLGRTSIGRVGQLATDNARLQEAANKERTTVGGRATGAAARLALYAGRKARSGSFDARRASIPTGVIGDAIQGTVGRTELGKKLGLDDVNIPIVGAGESLKIGEFAAGQTDIGTGREGGYKERKEESKKRVDERESKIKSEANLVIARSQVEKGANSTNPADIAEMEKALNKLSDKQIETLVSENKKLLDSLNFANKISTQQLEALNKSDKLSDSDKQKIKDKRFADLEYINDPAGLAALAVAPATRTVDEQAAADRTEKAQRYAKALPDAELEMINPQYLEDRNFVEQLRGGQVESITKSKKFTHSQKEKVKEIRRQPLVDALNGGRVLEAQKHFRKLGPKDVLTLMAIPGRIGPTGTPIKIPYDPAVLPMYTPRLLRKMAEEMNGSDIQNLRTAILSGGNPDTIAWLRNPAEGGQEFN